ncbi:hypothetical protein [Serinibacter salmoneus]|uniref:hypothetical protein n=1 Tax=Serinibacter salmoneus TaxID=556530 RepID=UPI00117A4502|nr:hypothetical protein [Serinibacter salmoneus]
MPPESAPATPAFDGLAATPPGQVPPSSITVVEDAAAARDLAQRLRARSFPWPVVLITVASGQEEPFIPAQDVADQVEGLAQVYVMPTGPQSWAFSNEMPPFTQVYGGASRVYAPDGRWLQDPYASPLRMAFSHPDGVRKSDLLVSDVFAVAPVADRSSHPVRTVSGMVEGVVATRGLVSLSDGGMASVWAELTVTGVPIERLLRPQQAVSGVLDETTNRLDISAMRGEVVPERVVADSRPAPGEHRHVLVRVESVTAQEVTVALVPGVPVAVPAVLAGPDAAEAFAAGDVVAATWWPEGEGHELRLDLWEEDDPIAPAPALLPDGPPWLTEADTHPDAAEGEEADGDASREDDGIDPSSPLGAEILELRRSVEERSREVARLRAERADLRRRLRAGRAGGGSAVLTGREFLDPVEQFRFEVHVAWAGRIPASDKARRPLRRYEIGPDFLTSLEALQGVSRSKVLGVVVEVLTDLAKELAGRDLHRLRESAAGGAAAVTREDGAVCYRAALQRETASARRLHYWERPDGVIELSRVVKHDDMTP